MKSTVSRLDTFEISIDSIWFHSITLFSFHEIWKFRKIVMDEILKLKAGKRNGQTYLNQPMLLLVAWNGLMKCTIRCTVSGFFSPLLEPLCHRRTVERLSAKSEIKSRRTVIKSSKSSRIDLKNGSKKQKKTENQHCRNFSDLLKQ